MPDFTLLSPETAGVDMQRNPLLLGRGKVAFAANLAFEEGSIKTRPDFKFHDLRLSGVYQGSGEHTPSLGVSAASYAPHTFDLAVAVSGNTHLVPYRDGVFGDVKLISPSGDGVIQFLSAENYLITYGTESLTRWWDGTESTVSRGYTGCEGTHDTFDPNKHENWLPHCAISMAYAHGRIHAATTFNQTGCAENSELLVSDLVTKRGCLCSDDILKMEEQACDSYGGPLVAPSRYGSTVALVVSPLNSLNGEGEVLDFRRGGVVRHNTLQDRRETRADGSGEIITEGWDFRRITNVKFQHISAVGFRAVEVLPADVLFRSPVGLHSLSFTEGIGTYQDEFNNVLSMDVEPLLEADAEHLVSGSSVGYWVHGDRFLTTTGMRDDENISESPYGEGFAVFNKSNTFTEDRTPRVTWEGLWHPPAQIEAVHDFHRLGLYALQSGYGFIGSTQDAQIVFGEFTENETGFDDTPAQATPIRWALETGATPFFGLDTVGEVTGGVLDVVLRKGFKGGKISVRSDRSLEWVDWKDIPPADEETICTLSMGALPKKTREATWFQFRVEGEGGAEILFMKVSANKTTMKLSGRGVCAPRRPSDQPDYFRTKHE